MTFFGVGIILLCAAPVYLQQWNFENPSENIRLFFEDQKQKVTDLVSSTYNDAVKVKDSFNNFLEKKQTEIADVNKYINGITANGRRISDSWSFNPEGKTEQRLENPDVILTVPAIVARHGYPCETHTVVSKGYVLNVHRIPRSKQSSETSSKIVFLQHGLFASSADWILNGPDKALAYVLSDAGYDVWMGNIRGNRYSKEHIWLPSNSKAYWNFSWHDIAQHDIPAVIDYIRTFKGPNAKIAYIGHSMGTTMLFAMLSLRPEYNSELTAGLALAPVVFMSDIKSPLKVLAPIASNVAYMEMLYSSHEFIPKNSALGQMAGSCNTKTVDTYVCKNLVFYFCGFNEKQFNKTLLPVFTAHLGTGTSWKTAVHFAQEIVAGGRFQQFDYGSDNRKLYGSESPPEYDLTKVTLPVTLFWSQNDLLSSETDVRKLYERLPPSSEMYLVPDPEFNHIDYLWAKDAPSLLNNHVLTSLDKAFNNRKDLFFSFRF